MKIMISVLALLIALPVSVTAGELSMNFLDSHDWRIAYAFASNSISYSDAYYLTYAAYTRQHPIDTILLVDTSLSRLDSLADLVSKKDDRFIESSHGAYVCQCFCFDMDEVHKILGNDSIVKAILKWKGESIGGDSVRHTVVIKIPQAGHGYTPPRDTFGDTLRSDAVDSTMALLPGWFQKGSFFQHELALVPMISNITDSITTLRTDYIEVVLITNSNTRIVLNPSRRSPDQKSLSVARSGGSQITVGYRITNQSNIALDLFSSNGKLVEHLDRGIKSPGNYRILWNGYSDTRSTVPDGTYILKLSEGGRVETGGFSFVR